MTAIGWAHEDTKLFVATTTFLHTINIQRSIPTLQDLTKSVIAAGLNNKEASFDLLLPTRFKFGIAETFSSIIKVNKYFLSELFILTLTA